MAGIPPLGGFFAKVYLFQSIMAVEGYGLIITGLVTSILSSYYYLRLIKIFWYEEETFAQQKSVTVYLNNTHRAVLVLLEGVL